MTRRAFTLIELIIATLILSVVIVSIYGAFSAGIKAWSRNAEGKDFQKIRIALLRIQKELRSSFFFSGIPFSGTSLRITFPAVEEKGKIYAVNYYIAEDRNKGCKVLMKRKSVLTDARLLEEQATDEFIFSADSISFEYAHESKDGLKGFEWKGIWEESRGEIPSLVKINFKLGIGKEIYHKIIFIPHEK